jgi:hypothetical protein
LPSARVSLGLGPSFGLHDEDTQVAFEVQGSLAVTPDHQGAVVASPQVQALGGSNTIVMLPVGFEYLVPLGDTGLYGEGRLSAGYAAQIFSLSGVPSQTQSFALVMPEAGLRYLVQAHGMGQLHVGVDAVSVPFFFASGGWGASYRAVVYGGMDFL